MDGGGAVEAHHNVRPQVAGLVECVGRNDVDVLGEAGVEAAHTPSQARRLLRKTASWILLSNWPPSSGVTVMCAESARWR